MKNALKLVLVALAMVASACGSNSPSSPSGPSAPPVVSVTPSIPSTPTVVDTPGQAPVVSVPYSAPDGTQVTIYVVAPPAGCASTVRTGSGVYTITYDQVAVYHGTAALFRGSRPWDCRGAIPTENPMYVNSKEF